MFGGGHSYVWGLDFVLLGGSYSFVWGLALVRLEISDFYA